MYKELDIIELTHDIKKYNLVKGARGTIVEIYGNGKAFEVEFISNDGKTTALLTLKSIDFISVLIKNQDYLYKFNSSVNNSYVSLFIISAKDALKGLSAIFGINESRVEIKTKGDGAIKEFWYSVPTI